MIKAIKLMVGLLSCGFIAVACADSATVLQQRLAKVDSFSARFTQQVTSASGKIVQQGKGELWLKRPNLFNWHMQQPDENSLISDGKTLWFYNPFIEQATATWLKQATSDTPFILISRNSSQDWQQYHVKQQADHFVLTPKKANSQLKQFTIDVNAQGVIHSFVALSPDDQHTAYQLFDQKNGVVPADKFVFRLPKGATLDDQRQ